MTRKICLFTAHSPDTGGGAVIIRSLIKNLPEYDIEWKYLANKPAKGYESGYMGKGIMGSSILNDIMGTWSMLKGKHVQRIDEITKQLLATECDMYWVVSHNEGIRVANELSARKSRPVHLTVHDDWAGSLSARSMRYRFMGAIAKKMTIMTLKKVTNFDVISKGMRKYYLGLTDIEGQICHRYLLPDSIEVAALRNKPDSTVINVGHIGSVYDNKDFIGFLSLLKAYGQSKKLEVKMNMWGYHPKPDEIPQEFNGILKIHGDMPEDKVIPELMNCNFVYTMYPASARQGVFSRTSLPTKLSSYVQSCRPIFGHGPADSTLAEFIHSTGTGVMWSENNTSAGMDLLEKVIALETTDQHWLNARGNYFGENNLMVMRAAFQ